MTFATSGSSYIEAFPLDRPFDAMHRLMTHSFMDSVKSGSANPPTEPGIGIDLDLAEVARLAYRHSRVDKAAQALNLPRVTR